ncbi:MAG TPA: erythromycin esterase family protein [Chloroflexota bacterium]|nr:erythromycin esterase family protein [Chloroflexota bacterium]
MASDADTLSLLRSAIHPLTGAAGDYDALLDLIGDAQFVLLGEASHGTHEFYRARAEITKRLITEKGFAAVAAEADWPDAYRVNRYIRDLPLPETGDADQTAEHALRDFQRFPQWMWRNADVLDLVGWLRDHNDSLPQEQRVFNASVPHAPHLGGPTVQRNRVGFYGLDLYSLYASIDSVIRYLDRTDPDAAKRARARYACFEHFEKDEQAYGFASVRGGGESCEDEVIAQLMDLQQRTAQRSPHSTLDVADEAFFAEQNARVAKNAEAYYREMFRGRDTSWNLRDSHMAETLDALATHLSHSRGGTGPAKIVVWAHNSHLGDARATQMSERGELNLGQLARQRFGDRVVIVGLYTYTGTVTAASDWDMPADRKRVRPALPESYEALCHQVSDAAQAPRFFLPLRGARHDVTAALEAPRLQRFIGVIYRPETERWSHYYEASLPYQYDALLYFDHSRALEPLERTPRWTAGEPGEPGDPPQTYPFAA